MPWIIHQRFRNQANQSLLAYLDRTHPSAHTDVGSALMDSANGLAGVHFFCPNASECAWLALHTRDNVIFALATGMSTVAFRLPLESIEAALKAGGVLAVELGSEWVQWRLGWHMDLKPWCSLALACAGNPEGKGA